MFTVTLVDFAQVTTWRKAVPMSITLVLFATFLGARVAIYGY